MKSGAEVVSVTMKKLSISLELSVAERAARAAERQGMTLSAWLNAAAARALILEDGIASIREWKETQDANTGKTVSKTK